MPHLLIVAANFYPDITDKLISGAEETLKKAGATYETVMVPGALEIAPAIGFAVENNTYDGFIALGCVIRGETFHFEIVCEESARGLTWLAIEEQAAIGNGILTVENEKQAKARLDKGADAARAALALIDLKEKFMP